MNNDSDLMVRLTSLSTSPSTLSPSSFQSFEFIVKSLSPSSLFQASSAILAILRVPPKDSLARKSLRILKHLLSLLLPASFLYEIRVLLFQHFSYLNPALLNASFSHCSSSALTEDPGALEFQKMQGKSLDLPAIETMGAVRKYVKVMHRIASTNVYSSTGDFLEAKARLEEVFRFLARVEERQEVGVVYSECVASGVRLKYLANNFLFCQEVVACPLFRYEFHCNALVLLKNQGVRFPGNCVRFDRREEAKCGRLLNELQESAQKSKFGRMVARFVEREEAFVRSKMEKFEDKESCKEVYEYEQEIDVGEKGYFEEWDTPGEEEVNEKSESEEEDEVDKEWRIFLEKSGK